jgi:hypothetical protein
MQQEEITKGLDFLSESIIDGTTYKVLSTLNLQNEDQNRRSK